MPRAAQLICCAALTCGKGIPFFFDPLASPCKGQPKFLAKLYIYITKRLDKAALISYNIAKKKGVSPMG